MRKLWIVVVLLALVAPAAPAAADPVGAEQQLDWVLDASTRPPVAEEEQRAHLSEEFLDAVGGPEQFNGVLVSIGPLSRSDTLATSPTSIEALATGTNGTFLVNLHVDGAGLVSGLLFRPYLPSPASWSELDTRLRALAPEASFSASVLDGTCRPAHQVDPDTPRPLGSAFKLYVLGALGERIAGGGASWDQDLPIREEWKSLPSGVLQDRPAGTKVTLREHANLMISISDNTATDHLVHFLGRDTVQRQLRKYGNSVPRANTPLLTTRELFAIKGFRYPKLANTYLSLPRPLRPALLPVLGAVPRTGIQPWTEPRNIDTIEWFGSANDMCRAYAGLWTQRDTPVADALSIEDAGIALDRSEYPVVWFKGGSEPGVLTLNHLARTDDGRVIVASVLLENPGGPIDPAAATEALALVRGGIQLASR